MDKRKDINVIKKGINVTTESAGIILLSSKHAILFITTLLCFTLLFTGEVSAQQSSCNKSCSQINDCKPAQNSNGSFVDSASHKINSSCVREAAKSGCFNGMPVDGGTGNYNSVGNRGSTRNHYGTDIGCTGYPNTKAYPVADDGELVWTGLSGGGGRTTVINFEKKCTGGSGGTHSGYHTVYRHLRKYLMTSGKVNRDDAIGIVGGSNYNRATGKLCDNPDQSPAPENSCSGYYAIHLHLELEDGIFSSKDSTQAKKNEILKPYCQNLNALCGGCPSTKNCDDGTKGGAFGSGGSFDGSVGTDGAGGGADSAESSCSYGEYLNPADCTFCDLFKTMFNTASQVALMADKGLLDPTKNLVKIGFLIWLAIYLLKQLFSFNATNSGEMAKGILFQGFRVAAVILILTGTSSLFYVMDLTLNPVMMTGLNFVDNIAAKAEGSSTCNKDDNYMKGIKGYSSQAGYASTKEPTGGLSTEVGEAIVCGVKRLEDSTGLLMRLGKFSMCLSWVYDEWSYGVLPHLGYFTTGIFLWLAGIALLLAFPWCLVDCILQLCIAAAMLPCAIGAYAFKITSKYLKIIWDFFMNAMFNFVFLALIIYIINQHLTTWLGADFSTEPNHSIFISFSGLAWYGMGFIRVAAVCFFCYVFFDEAKAMAEKFASSPGLGGGNGIGKMVGGTMASAGGVGLKAGAHIAGKGAKALGAGANAVAGNAFRSARNHAIGALASRFGRNGAVTGADGKTVGHEGSFRMLGRDIKFSATKGEDGKWKLTREVHKRSKTDKAFEKVLDKYGNEVKDENGNTKYRVRKRVFGITTGYEEMTASKDEDGNLVYASEETDKRGDPKFKFTMNEKGEIASYKTRFTRSYLGLGKAVEKKNIKQYGVNRTINTATSRTREKLDTYGNVTDSEIKMQDFSFFNRDLVRKDGTINIDTFNEMQKNIGDPKRAAQALVAQVMKNRGLEMDSKYDSRSVDIDDKGKVTIHQVRKDKEGNVINTQNIQAVMIGDQMFIAVERTDSDGNITLNESNGIFHTTQSAIKGKDGKYTYNFSGGFSDYVMSKNKYQAPLNHLGQWGNNIDRDKAMAGFTQAHYDKYLANLQLKQMKRTMSSGEYNRSEEVKNLYGKLHAEKLDTAQDAMKNMTYNLNQKYRGEQQPDSDTLKGEKNEVEQNVKDIQEIRQEIDKENLQHENLEKELRELKEKENKSDEEEERIKRELEELQKKLDELKKKQENINHLVAEIRANEFDVNRYAFIAGEHENIAYRQHQKLDAEGRVIVRVDDFGKGNIDRYEYKYNKEGNVIFEERKLQTGENIFVNYEYDSKGKKVSQRWESSTGEKSFTKYEYDSNGKMIYEKWKSSTGEETISEYDDNGKLSAQTFIDSSGTKRHFRYDNKSS